MAQIEKCETFTDVTPGKTVTSGRLNNHVDGAVLLVGAVSEQPELTTPTDSNDFVTLQDVSDGVTDTPKKTKLSNLLPETLRQDVPQYIADSGAANAYVATLSPAATAYTAGMVVRFKAGNANTAASTLNVNGLGVKNIFTRAGAALAANDILTGQICEVVYDGTQFLLQSAISAGEVTAAHLAESPRLSVPQYSADTGAANAYVATLSPAATAYTTGMVVRFKAANTNTAASTLNVNGLGVKNIFKGAGALSAGNIAASKLIEVVYDGTQFQLVGTPSGWDFTNTGAVPAANAVLTLAHGLGSMPTRVRAVLLQNTAAAQQGYAQNDEVDFVSLEGGSGGEPILGVVADATNITVARSNNASVNVIPKTGGNTATITAANWLVKVYASL